jgi:hypothetical protein
MNQVTTIFTNGIFQSSICVQPLYYCVYVEWDSLICREHVFRTFYSPYKVTEGAGIAQSV